MWLPASAGRQLTEHDVAHDHAVFQVVEETFERHRFVYAAHALVPRDAVNGDRLGISIDFDERVERVLDEDLGIMHGDGADRD